MDTCEVSHGMNMVVPMECVMYPMGNDVCTTGLCCSNVVESMDRYISPMGMEKNPLGTHS